MSLRHLGSFADVFKREGTCRDRLQRELIERAGCFQAAQVSQVAQVGEGLARVLDCDFKSSFGCEIVRNKGVIEAGPMAMALVWRENKELADARAREVLKGGGEVIVAIDSRVADKAILCMLGLLVQEENFPALVGPFVVVQLDVGATFDVEENKDLEVGEERFTGLIIDGGGPNLVGLGAYFVRCKESAGWGKELVASAVG